MNIRKGLNIDTTEKDTYTKVTLDADRQKSNFEQDIDAMLFGGMAKKKKSKEQPETGTKPKSIEKPPATVTAPTTAPTTVPTTALVTQHPADPKPTSQVKQSPPVVNQPKYEQVQTSKQVLHTQLRRIGFNRPVYIRKLKKVAEDLILSQENASSSRATDVVRPFETDRARMIQLQCYGFEDDSFHLSAVTTNKHPEGKKIVWKKPEELYKSVVFGKYIDPNDIKPGKSSSLPFLSILSSLAELELNTKRLLEQQRYNRNNFYLIRLFVNSVWRYVPVDGFLPFVADENLGAVSFPDTDFELSIALIEKAYAKVFGGYEMFCCSEPRQNYLRDLTGAPVRKYAVTNPDLKEIVKKALIIGQPISAVLNNKAISMGLNPDYGLNVIGINQRGNFEMRNPWGSLEEKAKTVSTREGTFEFGPTDAKECISHLMIAHIERGNFTSTIQAKHRLGYYCSFDFKVYSQSKGYLTLSQWDSRFFPPNAKYFYSPMRLLLLSEKYGFVNAVYTSQERNLDMQVNFKPGRYIVFCQAHWIDKEYDFCLTYYGMEKVEFKRIEWPQSSSILAQGLQAYNLAEGKKMANASANFYAMVHKESNLVVVTAQNSSDKPIQNLQVLPKLAGNDYELLTAKNPESENVQMTEAELDLVRKAWFSKPVIVSLNPKQQFTWILSTRKTPDTETLKAFGFK